MSLPADRVERFEYLLDAMPRVADAVNQFDGQRLREMAFYALTGVLEPSDDEDGSKPAHDDHNGTDAYPPSYPPRVDDTTALPMLAQTEAALR